MPSLDELTGLHFVATEVVVNLAGPLVAAAGSAVAVFALAGVVVEGTLLGWNPVGSHYPDRCHTHPSTRYCFLALGTSLASLTTPEKEPGHFCSISSWSRLQPGRLWDPGRCRRDRTCTRTGADSWCSAFARCRPHCCLRRYPAFQRCPSTSYSW